MENNLLLVDDEENIIRSLLRLLRRDGYNILTAKSGAEGLEILKQNEVNVILSDQRMPEMNGVEFLNEVKELYPDTVRMVLSGYTDLNSVTDAINRGAIYRFLTKPWEDELLRENIKQAFHQFGLVSENQRLTGELKKANELLKGDKENLEYNIKEKSQTLKMNLAALEIFQQVLERLPVAVIGIDDNGMVIIANSTAHKVLTKNERGLIGRTCTEVLSSNLLKLSQFGDEADIIKRQEVEIEGYGAIEAYCCRMFEKSDRNGVILVLLEKGKEVWTVG